MTTKSLHDLGSTVVLAGAIALWAALLLRTPGALRSRPQRRLLIAVAGLAASITVYLDPITQVLNRTYVLGQSCGIAMNIWGVISSAFILDFVLAAISRRRPLPVYGTAALVCVGLVALNTGSPAAGCVTSIAVPWYSPFWWLLCTAHVVAVLPCAILCARYARQASTVSLRVGLRLLAAGFTSSTIFWSVVVLGYLLTHSPWLGAAFPLCIGITAWLMVAAMMASVLAQGARQAKALRALRGLGPLWTSLVGVVPHVRLATPGTRFASVDLRLYRRVIEIRDALLILRDYVDDETVARARAQVLAAEPDPAWVEAYTTACWLPIAEAAKARGVEPVAATAAPPSDGAEDQWSGELAFLEKLAAARQSPLVAAVTAGADA
ncbi:MAB_1171c family putative transporter [Actinokineospora sp. NBRC 105648]|uniref:MAB_1171c family putative transporter n=1 Tax=Actinokineospora sp. NBRC 105648 TaxID=3032206 RepID=UPI0024A4D75D|nr:MAB_1171c family putative transporter [Actinokineospora sp. NBRC 105648]GLZ40838.1 hypothetical protein Acsp05_44620 [Actinokineospora sp. NBRC 105648]